MLRLIAELIIAFRLTDGLIVKKVLHLYFQVTISSKFLLDLPCSGSDFL